MPTRPTKAKAIKLIHFLVEMDNGDRYVMHLDSEQCLEVVGIAWGTLDSTKKHPWESLYEGLGALNKASKQDRQNAAKTTKKMGAIPIPKVRTCMPIPPTGLLFKLP